MFRVLQICNKAPYPANDGSSIAIYNMAKGFIENGVSLHLLTINTKKHFKPDAEVPEEFRKGSGYRSVYRNTNTSLAGAFLNLFSRDSYFVSRFRFRAFNEALISTLKENTFDIVQVEGLFMGVYIDTIKKHSNARIVLRAHNIEHYIWRRHISHESFSLRKLYLFLQNRRLKKFELSVIAKVDAIVTITKTDEAELKRLGCSKPIFTCITGVDVKAYQTSLGLPEKPGTVFYFGSMDWLPNQEAAKWFLSNCWPRIHHQLPEARLVIAGRGMPLEFFHITKPNVTILENVVDGKAFFQQHRVMVVPLRSGSGLRIKIIEGMAYGKAIVSTAVGAEGISYEAGRNILIADDAGEFADHVIRLLTSEQARKDLEKEAAAFARREFDNSQVVSRLMGFYRQLLNA